MRWGRDPVRGVFLSRINRFAALVEAEGQSIRAHIPNSGRLHELLVAGAESLLHSHEGPSERQRKTAFDLVCVRHGRQWVSLDARLPGVLLAEAIRDKRLQAFYAYDEVRPEVRVGSSRLDLALLAPGGEPCYVEAKSVTLVVDGRALFPDAPTARGVRHLEELARLAKAGGRAAVAFVIQREDAASFSPNDRTDPAFGYALRKAAAVGVEVYAYKCHVTEEEIAITDEIPVFI